jgi:hypothetical protein
MKKVIVKRMKRCKKSEEHILSLHLTCESISMLPSIYRLIDLQVVFLGKRQVVKPSSSQYT